MKSLFSKQQGQTAVEYIFLLMVTITIAIAAFKAIEKYLLTNERGFLRMQLKHYERFLGQDPKYQRFRIPGRR